MESFYAHLAENPAVYFIRHRTSIKWGGYSMVEATLTCFKEILDANIPCDFINLISESDYPLTSQNAFIDFLANHIGKTFMEYEREGSAWWEEAQYKVRQYHLVDYGFRGKYMLERWINKIVPTREIPLEMELVGRSQWFTIYTEHVKYMLDFLAENPKVKRFFKHTWGPDEMVFQTILFNSRFRDDLINENLRYIDWSEGKPSPKTLTSKDLNLLKSSGKFYARKFDENIDGEVLDKLDSDIDASK